MADNATTYYRILKENNLAKNSRAEFKYDVAGLITYDMHMMRVINRYQYDKKYCKFMRKSVIRKYHADNKFPDKKYTIGQENRLREKYEYNIKKNFDLKREYLGKGNLAFNFSDISDILSYAFVEGYEIIDINIPDDPGVLTGQYEEEGSSQFWKCKIFSSNAIRISNRRKITSQVLEELCAKGATLTQQQLSQFLRYYVDESVECCRSCMADKSLQIYTEKEQEDIIELYARHGIV